MTSRLSSSLAVILFGFVATSTTLGAGEPTPADDAFFETKIRPLLVERCLKCHDGAKPKGGLSLTSRGAILSGGASGPAAEPARPAESLIVEAIKYGGQLKMPPKQKLADAEIKALEHWVEIGLPWPESRVEAALSHQNKKGFSPEQRMFWSFQPPRDVPLPSVQNKTWPRNFVDNFILAKLEAKGLKPAPAAEKREMIRRATFDLTGLPPTPEEVETFLADASPDAFAKVVDRLLASPRYGECWARHWLDLVRYTDSFDARIASGDNAMDLNDAWRYRDWVVNAFNNDLAYDQFLTYQLAGDLLPRTSASSFDPNAIVATGVLAIGNWGGGDADKEKLLTDIVDDQVDLVGRAFMGLTIACARCHDHKFDPIPTRDYYGLAGIFFSSHILPSVGPKTNGPPMLRIPLESPAQLQARLDCDNQISTLDTKMYRKLDESKRALAAHMLAQTKAYVLAARDFQASGLPLDDAAIASFSAARGLVPFATRQWVEDLGFGDDPLLSPEPREKAYQPNIMRWIGTDDASALVNRSDVEVAITTLKLPPHSVAVHPSVRDGVVVGWKSPLATTLRIEGLIADADSVGGDGIAWALEYRNRRSGGRKILARGDIANGGSSRIDGDSLKRVVVEIGDAIELIILPKATHVCDTTVVELKLVDASDPLGKTPKVWSLTADTLADASRTNPRGDRLGHADVWRFAGLKHALPSASAPGTSKSSGGSVAETPTPSALWHEVSAQVNLADRSAVMQAAEKFADRFKCVDVGSPFWVREPRDEVALLKTDRAALQEMRTRLATLRKQKAPPVAYAVGVEEGGVPGTNHAGVHDVRVHIRGQYARLGELVPRHFPSILTPAAPPRLTESGRLELARWLTRPEHPLTARVLVNRVWQHHFGRGIVATASNFGKLGERPTHPELLDALALRFIREGWSIKRLHKLIMLSSTYQQSSIADPETRRNDPDNLLFGAMSRRRLEAEALRDALLAVAGTLDTTSGGPAFREMKTPRRTVYMFTVRSDRSSFGPLFDAADPTAIVDRRASSTVAPQALFLLNNAFAINTAETLARRTLAIAPDDPPRARIDGLYRRLFARPPTAAELELGLDSTRPRTGETRESIWTEYCQMLLCTNEFMYVD